MGLVIAFGAILGGFSIAYLAAILTAPGDKKLQETIQHHAHHTNEQEIQESRVKHYSEFLKKNGYVVASGDDTETALNILLANGWEYTGGRSLSKEQGEWFAKISEKSKN